MPIRGRASATVSSSNAMEVKIAAIGAVFQLKEPFFLWLKVVVVGACNLVGVFIVKWVEEKARKDKLWKIEATFDKEYLDTIHKGVALPHNYIDIGSHVIFNFYAENQYQSALVRDIVKKYNGKYFVSESKVL